MTPKMQEALRNLVTADIKRAGDAIDIHARTAWALQNVGLVAVDGASNHAHYQNGNYVSCSLTDRGRDFFQVGKETQRDDYSKCAQCGCTHEVHLVTCSLFQCPHCGQTGSQPDHFGGCPLLVKRTS